VYRLPIGIIRGALAALLAFAGIRMMSTGSAELLALVRDAIRGG